MGDADNLMVCEGRDGTCVDGRTRAFHCQCLPRPIAQPPEGRWVCHLCRPEVGRPAPPSPARVARDRATQHVHHLFGIPTSDAAPQASRRPRFSFPKSDLPKDYRLGLVIGPSGSGKTTALLELTDPAPGADPSPRSRASAAAAQGAAATNVAPGRGSDAGRQRRAARGVPPVPAAAGQPDIRRRARPQLSPGSRGWRWCRTSRPSRG